MSISVILQTHGGNQHLHNLYKFNMHSSYVNCVPASERIFNNPMLRSSPKRNEWRTTACLVLNVGNRNHASNRLQRIALPREFDLPRGFWFSAHRLRARNALAVGAPPHRRSKIAHAHTHPSALICALRGGKCTRDYFG
jgi:hypothetical protein